MDKRDFLEIFQPVISAFDARISKERIAVYYEHLRGFRKETFENAASEAIHRQDRFPSISQLLGFCYQKKQQDWNEQEKDSYDTDWLAECEAAGKFGSRMCAKMVSAQLHDKIDDWNEEKRRNFIRTAFSLQKEIAVNATTEEEAAEGLLELYGL